MWPSAWKELSPWRFTCVVFIFSVPFQFCVWGRVWNSVASVPDHRLFIYSVCWFKKSLVVRFSNVFAAHFAKHLWLNTDKEIFHLLNNPGECILRGHFQHISLNTCSFGLVLDLKAFILVRYVGVERYIHVI